MMGLQLSLVTAGKPGAPPPPPAVDLLVTRAGDNLTTRGGDQMVERS
jgi:hypothetical protein